MKWLNCDETHQCWYKYWPNSHCLSTPSTSSNPPEPRKANADVVNHRGHAMATPSPSAPTCEYESHFNLLIGTYHSFTPPSLSLLATFLAFFKIMQWLRAWGEVTLEWKPGPECSGPETGLKVHFPNGQWPKAHSQGGAGRLGTTLSVSGPARAVTWTQSLKSPGNGCPLTVPIPKACRIVPKAQHSRMQKGLQISSSSTE